eukprot:gene10836-14546_t
MSISYCSSNNVFSRHLIADVVEQVSPAVVNLVCSLNKGFLDSGASSGSGFIISKDGFIVTNAHVVNSAAKVVVTLSNGRKLNAVVHSMDAKSDLALVQITDYLASELPVINFGTSGKLRSGEFVIAIGSPIHLKNSASVGIISATARHARELGMTNNQSEYIQTDAAINLGNSGGPLVNLDGEVIGINTMKIKGTDGISFAIPIDTAVQIIEQLRVSRKFVRPYVGLRVGNFIDQSESSSSKHDQLRPSSRGGMLSAGNMKVVITKVVQGSPAHNCGMQSGDVILEIDGKPVNEAKDVLHGIGLEVGKSIEFKIRRQNTSDFIVTLTTVPEQS